MKGTKFKVTNIFKNISEDERRQIINENIKTLCSVDIEKICNLDYNVNDIFFSADTREI